MLDNKAEAMSIAKNMEKNIGMVIENSVMVDINIFQVGRMLLKKLFLHINCSQDQKY